MRLFFKGMEVTVDYVPATKGSRDQWGQLNEPDVPADIEITDVEFLNKERIIEMVYNNFYHELLDRAISDPNHE